MRVAEICEEVFCEMRVVLENRAFCRLDSEVGHLFCRIDGRK